HTVPTPRVPAVSVADPAANHRDESNPPDVLRRPQIPARREQAAAPPQPSPGPPGRNHEQSDADHGAERKEGRQNRRTILGWKVLEAGKQSIPAVGEQERS